jgi:hypothetical protein
MFVLIFIQCTFVRNQRLVDPEWVRLSAPSLTQPPAPSADDRLERGGGSSQHVNASQPGASPPAQQISSSSVRTVHPQALHLTRQLNLDALDLDGRINTARLEWPRSAQPDAPEAATGGESAVEQVVEACGSVGVHRGQHMAVDIHGHRDRRMAQAFADHLDRHVH